MNFNFAIKFPHNKSLQVERIEMSRALGCRLKSRNQMVQTYGTNKDTANPSMASRFHDQSTSGKQFSTAVKSAVGGSASDYNLGRYHTPTSTGHSPSHPCPRFQGPDAVKLAGI
jgi:hypothetical protein